MSLFPSPCSPQGREATVNMPKEQNMLNSADPPNPNDLGNVEVILLQET
jgi:hypothetical protein